MKKYFRVVIAIVLAAVIFTPLSKVDAKAITVYFDTDGGTIIPPVVLDDESLAGAGKIPDDPVKDGYTFIGWYPSNEFISHQRYQDYSFHEIYSEDITLYARFIKNENIINSVNVTVEPPKAGTNVEVTVDTSHGAYAEIQTNIPKATPSESNANYEVSYTAWVKPKCGQNGSCDERFEGTIEEGEDYYANITIDVKDGYFLSNNLTIKVNGQDPYSVYSENPGDWIFFVGKVKAVKDTSVKIEAESNTIEDNKAKTEVLELINKIINDEEVTGIDEELANQIKDAVNNGKTIVVDVASEIVEKDAVSNDAKKIENSLKTNEKVGAYFDIDVVVKVDDNVLGNVTKLNDKITVSVNIPNNLPAVPEGYKRIFKIIRVHDNGDPEELTATENGNKVSFDTDRFSTYALVYEDVPNSTNPNTADNIMFYITLLGLSIIGLTGTILYKKRFN